MRTKKLTIIATSIGILLLSLGVWAQSEGYFRFSPDTPGIVPMTMPYQGIMEKNGKLFTGQIDFRVTLCNDLTSEDIVDVNSEDPGCYWGPEVHNSVQVQNGSFSLTIGDPNALDENGEVIELSHIHIDKLDVWLKVEIKGQNDANFISMGARQKLHSSPYAIRSFRAEIAEMAEGGVVKDNDTFSIINEQTDLDVFTVDYEGDTWIYGGLNVNENVIVFGAGVYYDDFSVWGGDATLYKQGDLGGDLWVQGKAEIDEELWVSGNIVATGNLRGTCDVWMSTAADGHVACSNGRYITELRVGGEGSIEVLCCEL